MVFSSACFVCRLWILDWLDFHLYSWSDLLAKLSELPWLQPEECEAVRVWTLRSVYGDNILRTRGFTLAPLGHHLSSVRSRNYRLVTGGENYQYLTITITLQHRISQSRSRWSLYRSRCRCWLIYQYCLAPDINQTTQTSPPTYTGLQPPNYVPSLSPHSLSTVHSTVLYLSRG